MKSLFTRFYLSLLALLAVFAIAAFAAWHYLVEPPARPGGARWVIELAREKLPASMSADQISEQLRLWQRRSRADVLVVDLNGKPLASAGDVFEFKEDFSQWRANREEGWIKVSADSLRRRPSSPWAFGVQLDGGERWIFMRRPSPRHSPSGWLPPNILSGLGIPLIVITIALGVIAYPLLRRLTKRIKSLNDGVAQFGKGDLSARVNVVGDDEIAKVGRTFNQAASQVEGLVKSQRSLLANASHELRSPLARLKMALELGGEGVSPRAKAEIDQNIQELDSLVDDILLSSRLEAAGASGGQVKREAFDLYQLLLQETQALQALGEKISLTTNLGDAPTFSYVGDARLIRRAVRNLLENARRYAAGKPMHLHLASSAQAVEISLEDHGPGIPLEERERVFEPFYRAKGASEAAGGVGLGLALVKQIAQAHGGKAECYARTDEQEGSRFAVVLSS